MHKWLIFAALFLLQSCSTIRYQKEHILAHNDVIKTLAEHLEEAATLQVAFLSPSLYQMAESKMRLALRRSEYSMDGQGGTFMAKDGIQILAKAKNIALRSQEIFRDALRKRSCAQNAQAQTLLPEEFGKLENRFMKACKMVEASDFSKAQQQDPVLAKAYFDLEIKALRSALKQETEVPFGAAIKVSAHKLAPKTFKDALKELEIAQNIIEVEKGQRDNAQLHVEKAKALAQKAQGIAEIVTLFSTQKKSSEEIVLWYQNQIETLLKPLQDALSFDMSNEDLISRLAQRIEELISFNKSLQAQGRESENQVQSLHQQIASLLDEKARHKLEEDHRAAQYLAIQKLFNEQEAEVLVQGNDILIRSFGLNFPWGSAQLLNHNFAMLHKLETAILKFPKAKVRVIGHTDSTGSNQKNLELSSQRAQNVADFFVKVTQIAESDIEVRGLGDTQPLASNQTPQGRTKNRRIEVHIVNGSQDLK